MTARSQAVAAMITRAILSRRLQPGTKLGERELAEIFDVSRIVVRQALIRVSDDGLVTMERHRGAFVSKPGIQEAIEVAEAIILIENGILPIICDRISRQDVAQLTTQVEAQRKALDESNWELADHLGREFHSLLVGLGNNQVVNALHAHLARRNRLLQALYRNEFDYRHLCADHHKILAAVQRRQVKRAQRIIEEHYTLLLRGLRIDADPAQPAPGLAEVLATMRDEAWPTPATARAKGAARTDTAANGAGPSAGAGRIVPFSASGDRHGTTTGGR